MRHVVLVLCDVLLLALEAPLALLAGDCAGLGAASRFCGSVKVMAGTDSVMIILLRGSDTRAFRVSCSTH